MPDNRKQMQITYAQLRDYILNNAENGIYHHTYGMEETLIGSLGKPDFPPESMADNFSRSTMGILSHNPRKQAEYTAVAAAVLASRYAIEAGADTTEAYCLGDLYMQRISEFKQEEEYWEMLPGMMASFQELIAIGQRRKDQNYHIQKVKNYISQNSSCPITVKMLADYAQLTPNYLSAVFKQSEGISVMEYVRQARIAAAEQMLRFSDRSICEIAAYLCFSSTSHFSACFKKYTGMRPSEYRRRNHSW